ncbi:hypothetical protein PBY51_014741 [Eleginops maclovinus]|uniref:Uncharacterized protein n=1 Tax=Eleginops maclovinus TaxID=56733 RepID=A0AAN7X640_ELEMC|nr:hypothetical protein PBY51_014741 [Eleginops maclovinus]
MLPSVLAQQILPADLASSCRALLTARPCSCSAVTHRNTGTGPHMLMWSEQLAYTPVGTCFRGVEDELALQCRGKETYVNERQ